MTKRLEDFLAQYDPTGGYRFDPVRYRPMAAWGKGPSGIELSFGLTEGYRRIEPGKPDLEWGWARIHTGEDRSGASPDDGVYVPFEFDRIAAHHDETTRAVYGMQLRLISDRWGFEVRVAHMHPTDDLDPKIARMIASGIVPAMGTRLGRAGFYGVGSGRHTHTEIVSAGRKTSDLLDELLAKRYPADAARPYTFSEVATIYYRYEHTKGIALEALHEDHDGPMRQRLMDDYARLCRERSVVWANRFKHVFLDPYSGGAERTRYSSRLLFSM